MSVVFISYARDDSHKVNRITSGLKASYGFEFWRDVNNIRNGKDWPEEITKAIVGCSRFLLFMSAASMVSDNVKREVQIAYENKKKIIILRLDKSKLPFKLSYQLIGIQRTDYLSSGWEDKIVSALSGRKKVSSKTNINVPKRSFVPKLKASSVKPVSLRVVISELEGAFSVNGDYYKDQCDATLKKLDDLRVIVANHWVNPAFVYDELIPRVFLIEKIDVLSNLIKDFQDTCPPGLSSKRQLIHSELMALIKELG